MVSDLEKKQTPLQDFLGITNPVMPKLNLMEKKIEDGDYENKNWETKLARFEESPRVATRFFKENSVENICRIQDIPGVNNIAPKMLNSTEKKIGGDYYGNKIWETKFVSYGCEDFPTFFRTFFKEDLVKDTSQKVQQDYIYSSYSSFISFNLNPIEHIPTAHAEKGNIWQYKTLNSIMVLLPSEKEIKKSPNYSDYVNYDELYDIDEVEDFFFEASNRNKW